MKKTAIILMIITLISKFFGFFRDITLSYFYGVSGVSDAYLVSTTIPVVIFGFVGVGISTGYIPMYSNIENKKGTEFANRYTNKLITMLLIICTIIVILSLNFTEGMIRIFAVGFQGETLSHAVLFTRISIFGVYFSCLIYIFNGFLQIKNEYLIPAIAGIPLNIIIMFSILISFRNNIVFLSIGTLFATVFQAIFLAIFAKKKHYRFKLDFDLRDPNIKKMIYIAIPVILGGSVNQINLIVDRTLASKIAVGGISALNYANRLNGFIQSIFVSSIAVVMYPMVSKMIANNELKGVKKALADAVGVVNLIVLPTTIGTIVFSENIIRLLFGRGAFDENAILLTSYALFFYSIGMLGFGLREILSRVFYSMQDTKTPMVNASIGMILNIILNLILSKYLGIGGLALATSIAAIFTSTLLFISLRKKIGPFGMKQISISFVKILFASLVMGGLAKLSFNYLTSSLSQNLSLLIAIGVGAVSYFVIIYFMKIEDVDVIVGAIKKKLVRGAV